MRSKIMITYEDVCENKLINSLISNAGLPRC